MSETRLLPTDELLRSIVDEVTEIRIREHSLLLKIAEMDRRGAANELGYKDLPKVLQHAVRWDAAEAKKWVTHAQLLSGDITPTGSELEPALPLTAQAAAEGALSIEHVVVIAKAMATLRAEAAVSTDPAAKAEAETGEAQIVDAAREFTPYSVRTFGERLVYSIFQNDREPRDPAPQPQGNHLTKQWNNGKLHGKFTLDEIAGAQLEALLDPLAKPRPSTPEEGPDPRKQPERDGDALAELIALMLRADQMPTHGGEPVTLTLTLPYEDLAAQVGAGMLDTGDRIPAEQVRKLACDAGIIPMLLGRDSQPLDVGRKDRTCTTPIRRVLVARDRGCAFPGCTRPPKHCDGHHIIHWADGGVTSADNMTLLCRHHHMLIHRSEWEVRMVGGLPTFFAPAWLDPDRIGRRNKVHHVA